MKKASTHTILLSAFFVVVFGALFFMFSQLKQENQLTGAQVIEFSPSIVTISGVSPSSVFQFAVVQLNISGADFNSSAVVNISNITVLSTFIVSDTLIEANISVPISAGDGVYDVTVNQDNESSTLSGGLTILEGPFDPSTLTNVTPAGGYIDNSDIVNLTYNISTAFGVDPSTFNITGGYIEIENLNTSNDTYLDLINWTSSGGTFTVMFAEHNYTEDGDYFGEIYLNVTDGITTEEREYYSYFGVGDIGCFIPVGTCSFNATVGVPFEFNVSVFAASFPLTSCSFGVGFPPGCSVAPAGPPAKCTITCTPTTAGFFSWTLTVVDPPTCLAACIANITGSPPSPSTGGSGGGSNPYPARTCCCLEGSLKGKITVGKDCQNSPHNANCRKSTENTEDPVCSPSASVSPPVPKPKPVVQQAPVSQPVVEQQVQTEAAPAPMPPSAGKAIQLPVVEESSVSSVLLSVLAVVVIIAGLVYWQFFRKHK